MKRMRVVLLLILVLTLVASACSSDDSDDTTTTTAAAGGGDGGDSGGGETVTLKFWSTETQPARLEKTQEIIDGFTAATGIQVQLTATNEDALPQLMITNAASGTLPDVVFHPLDFTVGWASAGLLDTAAAQEVVNNLGAGTFSEGALALATVD